MDFNAIWSDYHKFRVECLVEVSDVLCCAILNLVKVSRVLFIDSNVESQRFRGDRFW